MEIRLRASVYRPEESLKRNEGLRKVSEIYPFSFLSMESDKIFIMKKDS